MATPFWLQALVEACRHAYHPALYSQHEEGIVKRFLWKWEVYPSPLPKPWEQLTDPGREYESRSSQDIFAILQRSITEGNEFDRAFALFLIGGLATPGARDLLFSFVTSENRKERWASTISLGRLKDERVFAFLPTLLLEGFSVFDDGEQLQEAQEAFRRYRRTIKEQGGEQATLPAVWMDLCLMDYEWYLCQRSECALLLGAWGNPVVAPKLCEALHAAWKMEQEWPDYIGQENARGPIMWYFFQDSLTFALGQLGAWDALSAVAFPKKHLCIARIYVALGALQGDDSSLFYQWHNVFRYAPEAEISSFVESAPVRRFLAEHFAVSEAEQEDALLRWPHIWYERARESGFTPLPDQWQESGQPGPYGSLFDFFLDSDTLP